MSIVRKATSIEAPVAQVYSHVLHPENFPSYWPSMLEVANVKKQSNGGYSFDWVYKMAGVKVHGHTDIPELTENQSIVAKSTTGIPSTFRWGFQGRDGHTEVRLEVEYTPPNAVLGKIAAPILDRINEHEAEAVLKNLKAMLEGQKL